MMQVRKNNKIIQIIILFILSSFTLNSIEFEDRWFLNKIYTGIIYENHRSFIINNFISKLNQYKLKEVLIDGKFVDYNIHYDRNGLVSSVDKNGELFIRIDYTINNEIVNINYKRLNGLVSSNDIYDEKEKLLHRKIAFRYIKNSNFDTLLVDYTLKRNEKNNYYLEESNSISITGGYTHSLKDSYYAEYDTKLNLLEIGNKNINFFDFICDSYYPYLTIDYKKDTLYTNFDSNSYLTDDFASEYRTYTTIYVNDSTAIIKYPKKERFKHEIDEIIFFNNKKLPTKIIKYYTQKKIDTIMFDYKYYTD